MTEPAIDRIDRQIGLFGAVVVGWAVLIFVTLPSAIAWLVIMRSVGRLASRRDHAGDEEPAT
jgi:hypothetical protein